MPATTEDFDTMSRQLDEARSNLVKVGHSLSDEWMTLEYAISAFVAAGATQEALAVTGRLSWHSRHHPYEPNKDLIRAHQLINNVESRRLVVRAAEHHRDCGHFYAARELFKAIGDETSLLLLELQVLKFPETVTIDAESKPKLWEWVGDVYLGTDQLGRAIEAYTKAKCIDKLMSLGKRLMTSCNRMAAGWAYRAAAELIDSQMQDICTTSALSL